MRFHVVSVPFTMTTDKYSACAFTEKVRKFCIMMHQILGHEVYLYAGRDNEAPCTEHIEISTPWIQSELLQGRHYTQGNYDYIGNAAWDAFTRNAVAQIQKHKQAGDFICIISGVANKAIGDAHPDCFTVEFGIGYPGSYAQFRVFESYAWMHMTYGNQQGLATAKGNFFDAVIPSYFEADRFPVKTDVGKYLLFVGRLTELKGTQIAEQLMHYTGLPLHVCGTGDQEPPEGAIYHGVVEWEARGVLMANALCLIAPTLYVEPFGSVAVEAQMCGTPVLTTDWGAFTETVEHDVTGYRCRTMKEFVDGALQCATLDRTLIAEQARRLYSLETVARQYDTYFKRLSTLKGAGFYEGL